MRRSMLLGSAMAAVVATVGAARAGSFTFDESADWNLGVFASTNSTSGLLALDPNTVTTFNHIWVAASGRGTVIRLDTNYQDLDDGVADNLNRDAVLGEYRTAPQGQPANPSRTTVDNNGDVWVGNRDQGSGGLGSAAKISATPTGTTSTGVWNGSTYDALPWSNAGGADTNGGTSTATDTAISLYIRTAGTGARSIAVDADNDVWVGGLTNHAHQKYDGDTGAPASPVLDNNVGGYGAVIDSNGILWTSDWANSRIGRIDTTTDTILAPVATGGRSYGLAVDSGGNIWNSHYDQQRVTKLDSNGNILFTVSSGGNLSRGVAVTPDDDIWIANSGSNTVTRLDNVTGAIKATIPVGGYPTGVAVDSNGKVWVTNLNGNSVMRIDTATNAVDLTVDLGPGSSPYNYSDMTGSVLGGVTNPTGTWTYVIDSGATDTQWDQIVFNTLGTGSVPPGTGITLQVRTADATGDLGAAAWTAFLSGTDMGLAGRYAEVRATLTRTGTGPLAPTPLLSDLTLFTSTPDGVIPLPASGLLMLAGGAAFAALRRRRRQA